MERLPRLELKTASTHALQFQKRYPIWKIVTLGPRTCKTSKNRIIIQLTKCFHFHCYNGIATREEERSNFFFYVLQIIQRLTFQNHIATQSNLTQCLRAGTCNQRDPGSNLVLLHPSCAISAKFLNLSETKFCLLHNCDKNNIQHYKPTVNAFHYRL